MTDVELARAVQKNEDRSKSNTKRIDALEEKYNDLSGVVAAVSRLDEKVDIYNKNTNEKVDVLLDGVKDEMKELTAEVKEHHSKSGKRWDSIVEKALLTIVSAVVLWMLAKIGI